MGIYLDYNASAPISEEVLEVMIDVYRNHYGNADSRTHLFGEQANSIVEHARGQVADLLSVRKEEVLFTSGATESNNIVMQGLQEYAEKTRKKHIITTSIEHKSLLESALYMQKKGFDISYVNPNEDGVISVQDVISLVRSDTLLVSIMHVNNETGCIQPVKELGEYLSHTNILFHIDATQSFGKLVEELKQLKYDLMSVSAHKIGGPQGIGSLILRKKAYKYPPIKGIMYGGSQERKIRPGTIPVALVAGFGKACELVSVGYGEYEQKCSAIKQRILDILNKSNILYKMHGEHCICNTLNVCIYGISSEALMLSSKQFCGISNGSACNSNSYKPSYVLEAMGLSEKEIDSSIRISWGADQDIEEITESIAQLLEIAKLLKFN